MNVFSTIAFGLHILHSFKVEQIVLDLEGYSHRLCEFGEDFRLFL